MRTYFMTDPKVENLAASIGELLGTALVSQTVEYGELTVVVQADAILAVAKTLRDEPELAFRQLSDLAGIDYLSFGQCDWQTRGATDSGFSRGVSTPEAEIPEAVPSRFAVVYHLLSIEHNCRVRVKAYLNDDAPRIDSVVEVWPSADWYEREAFDLFGILFDSHPDLRRILTDYGFIGHPFRKDFPLEGHVEVRYDPDKKRVIYQPVTIENRVLVPKVRRDDGGSAQTAEDGRTDA
ncbi:MAG TPA: NADH-quinone oxidoreductase subunit C [Gammaproteobacteria bacterium]|nr:NADH-quinone oxidoreductase subunit C [Gammaproteobacteria bacterium]